MPNVRQDNTRNKYNWPGQLLNCLSASLRFIFILFCLKAKTLFISFSLVCFICGGETFRKKQFHSNCDVDFIQFHRPGYQFYFRWHRLTGGIHIGRIFGRLIGFIARLRRSDDGRRHLHCAGRTSLLNNWYKRRTRKNVETWSSFGG